MGENHPIASALHLLGDILEREKSRSASVHVSSESYTRLSSLPGELLQLNRRLSEKEKKPVEVEVKPEVKVAEPADVQPNVEPRLSIESAPEVGVEQDEKWIRKQLNEVYRKVKGSEECRALGTLFETVVFAVGNPCADLMFVGEAPGAEEEKQRKPFVGPAGQKLTQIIQAMGLSRDDVYISNIVKFRPKKGDGRFQGSSNRKPDPTEMAACIPFIRREIELVKPKVIVALGLTAAEGLLEIGGTLSNLRNETHSFDGVPVIVTYHPSYILRQEGEGNPAKAKRAKRLVWEDILRAMEILGMPISEKQRGYFT